MLGWLTGPGRRRAWRRRVARKALAAGCAGAAVLGVLGAARSSGERATAPALVAARSLEAGAVLRVGDVRVMHWPAEAVSAAWAVPSVAMVEGRVLAGPLARGEPVTDGRLLGPDLLEGQPPGTMAVHVPLSDPVAQELVGPWRPGRPARGWWPRAGPEGAAVGGRPSPCRTRRRCRLGHRRARRLGCRAGGGRCHHRSRCGRRAAGRRPPGAGNGSGTRGLGPPSSLSAGPPTTRRVNRPKGLNTARLSAVRTHRRKVAQP